MKKLLMGLALLFFIGVNSSKAQETHLEQLKPVSYLTVNAENSDFIKVKNANLDFFNEHISEEIDFEHIIHLKVKDENIETFQLSVTNKDEYNNIIIVYNKILKESIIFYSNFVKKDNLITNTYQTNEGYKFRTIKTLLNDAGNTIGITLGEAPVVEKTCFKDCMERQEDNFEATFKGWVYWNLIPATQVMAAVNCEGCCEKWWKNDGC